MFPYTPTKFYHCLESAVVSTVDKLCAAAEVLALGGARPPARRAGGPSGLHAVKKAPRTRFCAGARGLSAPLRGLSL